jgi:2-polyprenyl-6-methoxyphenol hydroxylase-like FAD-dependent oxidoreductase
VVVVEAAARVRPAPGETLHPGVEPVLERLGLRDAVLAAGFHRHRGTWVTWNGARRFEAFGGDASGPWLGFQAERRRLHGIMLEAALDLGAELHRPLTADGLLVERGRVVGVLAAGRELRARWTADGTGRRAWLARALRLGRTRCSPAMRVRFGWAEGDDPDLDGQPSIAATRGGWEWHAPVGGGRTAWVTLTVAARPGDGGPCRPGTDVSWSVHRTAPGPATSCWAMPPRCSIPPRPTASCAPP